VSTIATEDEATTRNEVPREWTRTPEQQRIIAEHREMVSSMYAPIDPDLAELLEGPETMGTSELAADLGYLRRTRVFQLYTEQRDLALDDQVPHPSAIPETDATAGHRGAREIRGIMRGRWAQWALQSGRFYWDPMSNNIKRQTSINHGGAPRRS
jgi:hypothetical protein